MPGIYIHIPFCDTKCIYCDFYSITDHSGRKDFIKALLNEIIKSSQYNVHGKIDTIYFGGGTPSLLTTNEFSHIFETIYKHFSVDVEPEITIEANPGTLDSVKLREFRTLPINRLSFGIQSFNDKELKYLSRIHSSGDAVRSIKESQNSGYENINADLIFSIPGQSREIWINNLDIIISLDINHISAYSLIFEDGTPLYVSYKNGKIIENDISYERDLYDLTSSAFTSNGFEHYEISNYAKKGYKCRHNLKYWNYDDDYFGFGPSAVSFINKIRRKNIRNLNKYISYIENKGNAVDTEEFIDFNTELKEFIFLNLRSTGIELEKFQKRFNKNFLNINERLINSLIENNYALIIDNIFKLTQSGYAVCDEISTEFF